MRYLPAAAGSFPFRLVTSSALVVYVQTLVRRAAMTAASLAVAGGLFLGSGVDQAEAAVSFVPPVPVTLLGDSPAAEVATAAGEAVCDASVVCLGVVSAGLVGAALYASRDTWMPWISNAIGTNNSTHSGASPSNSGMVLSITGAGGPGSAVTFNIYNPGGGSGETIFWYNVICQTSGVNTKTSSEAGEGPATGATINFSVGCGGSGSPIYAWVDNATEYSTSYYPANLPTWSSPSSTIESGATYSATVQCVTSGGSTVNLTETTPGGNSGVVVPSCSAAGLGSHGDKVTICAELVGTSCGPTMLQVTPTSTPSQPVCAATATAVCYWEIQVDGKPCLVGADNCANWYSIWDSTPSRVACYWGPVGTPTEYSMPVGDCAFLQYAYQTGGATYTGTGTSPITSGSSDTGTGTGTGTAGTGSTTPTVNPTIPSSSTGECFPTGWAVFDPVDWVLKPVECAMVWAFEPDSATLTAAQTTLSTDVGTSGVGPLISSLGGLISSLGGSGSGCQGPEVNFDLVGIHEAIYPFSACTDPMATAAAAVYALSSVTIVIWGGLALIRAVAAGFGFEFRMGGSKSDGD